MCWQDTWRCKDDVKMTKGKRLYSFDILVREREEGTEVEFGRSLS